MSDVSCMETAFFPINITLLLLEKREGIQNYRVCSFEVYFFINNISHSNGFFHDDEWLLHHYQIVKMCFDLIEILMYL